MSLARRFGGAGLRRAMRGGASVARWSPAEFGSGMTVWLRGDDPALDFAGFTWPNPGAAADFTQGTAANKPSSRSLASLTAADFDGTDDFASGGLLSAVIGANWWASGVFYADAVSSTAATPAWGNHQLIGDTGAYYSLSLCTTGMRAYHASGGTDRQTPVAAFSTGAVQYFEASFNGSTLSCRINGNAAQTVASGAPDALTGTVRLGDTPFGAAFDGAIAEIVVATAIPDASTLASWRTYAARWGVTTP